jgi:SSS family solute:Na+ symporter
MQRIGAGSKDAMTNWLPIVIITVYLVALFATTWWARRLTARGGGGLVGYLLAGRGLPAPVSAALLAGLAVGGVSTIGTAAWAYQRGISAGWYNVAWAAAAMVMGLGLAKRYRRAQITTLPELFEHYYSTTGRIIAVIGQLIIQVVITSLQYVAGGAILHTLLPVSNFAGMLITAIVFIGITLIGGFWAAGLTNVINVLVIYAGVILAAVLSVGKLGGLGVLAGQLPAGHPGFDLLAMGPWLIVAWFLVMITMAHSTQSVIQVGFAAKDEGSAARGYLVGGLFILPVGFISAIIGMVAAIQHVGINPNEALPTVALSLPPIATGIVLAGLWAADVSTASALLMGSATLVCSDLIKRFFAPNLSASREQLVCRLTVSGLSVVTFCLALTIQSILQMLLIGLTLSTAYTLIVIMTMFWPGVCRRSAASWTLTSTMVALAAWLLAPASWRFLPHPIYFTWLVSLVTFFLVAVFDRRCIAPPGPRTE